MKKKNFGRFQLMGISASAVLVLLTSMAASSVALTGNDASPVSADNQADSIQLSQRFRLRDLFNQRQRNGLSVDGAIKESIDVNGNMRSFYLVNSSTSPETNRPLLIVLHGGGGSAKSAMRVTRLGEMGKSNNFDVIFPEGSNLGHPFRWNNGIKTDSAMDYVDDISFIDQIVDQYARNNRPVFIAGLSNGGMMALRQLCSGSSRFDGAFIVAASTSQQILDSCAPKASLPILLVHGKEDSIVQFNGGLVVHGKGSSSKSLSTTPLVSHKVLVDFWEQENRCSKNPFNFVNYLSLESDSGITIQNFVRPLRTCKQTISMVVNDGEHGWPTDPNLLSARDRRKLETRRRIAGKIAGKDSMNPGDYDLSGFISKLIGRWTVSPYS